MRIKSLRRKVIVAISLGLLVYIALFLISDLKGVEWGIIYWEFLVAALLLTLGNYLLRFWRYKYYIKKLGVSTGRRLDRLIFFSGLTMSITPMKSGEALKSYLIKEVNGTPMSKTLPMFFAERIGDLIGLSLLGVLCAFSFVQNIGLLAGVMTAVVAAVLIFRNRAMFLMILRLLGRVPFLKKYLVHFEHMYISFDKLFTNRIFLFTVAVSTISWALEGVGLWFIVGSFGANIPVSAAVFIFSFGTVAGAVSMLPGGLGVAEGGMYYLLLQAGLLAGVAAASTILIRLATLWFGMFIGLICLWLFEKEISRRIRLKKMSKQL